MPTFTLVNEAVVEIQALGRLAGQRTRNTFHYTYVGENDPEGVARLGEFEDAFNGTVWAPFLAQLSEDYVHEFNTIQAILPTRYRALTVEHGDQGGTLGASLPPSDTMIIRRQCAPSGRRYQGRIFLPGVPVSSVEDGRLNDDAFAALDLIKDNIFTELAAAVPEKSLRPIIHYTGVFTGNDVPIFAGVDRTLRIQRRREVGVGE